MVNCPLEIEILNWSEEEGEKENLVRAGLSERMRGDKQGSMTIGSHVVMFNESAEPTLKEKLTYEPHKYREEVKFRGERGATE